MDDLSKILFLWIFCYLGCCSTMKKNNFINEILNDMFVMFFFLISSWKEEKSIVILMIGRERKRDIRLDKFQF